MKHLKLFEEFGRIFNKYSKIPFMVNGPVPVYYEIVSADHYNAGCDYDIYLVKDKDELTVTLSYMWK